MNILQKTESGIRYILQIPDEEPKKEDTEALLTDLMTLLWEQSRR